MKKKKKMDFVSVFLFLLLCYCCCPQFKFLAGLYLYAELLLVALIQEDCSARKLPGKTEQHANVASYVRGGIHYALYVTTLGGNVSEA